MRKLFIIVALLIVLPQHSNASSVPKIQAQGVAVYGWRDGKEYPLYTKNPHKLYAIASITKLTTALVALEQFSKNDIFTLSNIAIKSAGETPGMEIGATYKRDDILRALLVGSSNDAAIALFEPIGRETYIQHMNDFLHKYRYTTKSFVNTTGLDPLRTTGLMPNRLTPHHTSRLISDIYLDYPELVTIMSQDEVTITDTVRNTTSKIQNTNRLYLDPLYKNKIMFGKTGTTKRAAENIAFVIDGGSMYDYRTVVLFQSTDRDRDSRVIIDWLEKNDR